MRAEYVHGWHSPVFTVTLYSNSPLVVWDRGLTTRPVCFQHWVPAAVQGGGRIK